MRRPVTILMAMTLSLSLAGCAGDGGGDAPTATAAEPPAASAPAASAPAASVDVGAAGGCSPSTETATVTVTIDDFLFAPADVQATVGDVIGFTNAGSAPHTATLDEGDCTTATLEGGAAGALAFDAPGTYPYHCRIHSAMTGTITITE